MIKEQQITGNGSLEKDRPEQHEKAPLPRTSDGRFKKGFSGNYNGAPKKSESVVERFRSHDGCQSIINKLFEVANTLDDAEPHTDALASAKLIVERLIPQLKASELKISDVDETGFVYLPSPGEPERDE